MLRKEFIVIALQLALLHGTGGEEYEADILILGAGMTGISAAKHLTKLGQENFIIIEGANRIGGRVREQKFGGKTVEVGANWIHGTEGNPLYDLAKKYGLKMVVGYNYEDVIVRNHDGTDVTHEAEKYMHDLKKAINSSEKIRVRKVKNYEPDVTYRGALSMSGWIPNNNIMDAVEYAAFDFEYAVPPEVISLKNGGFYMNYETFKDEDAFVVDERGFVYLLKRILEEFMEVDDEKLHLGKVVTKIEYSKNGVTVTTNNGDIYRGKFAVCTFSVGVLENNVVEFKPTMPSWKNDVINNFVMVYYLKIFVKFPDGVKRFWDKETQIYRADPRRGYFSFIQNLEAKDLFPAGTNLLLATVTGAEAVRASRVQKSQLIQELDQIFKDMYGEKATEIEDILVPDWIENKLEFGMYSSWPIGVTDMTFEMLRLPIGAVYFAGEYTSKFYYGYLHGAWFEGMRVAEALYKCKEEWTCDATYRHPHKAPYYYKEMRD